MIVNLIHTDSHDDTILLPKAINQNLSSISFGHNKIPCTFVHQENHVNTILLPRHLTEKLNLPISVEKVMIHAHHHHLIIGPLIGIFTAGFTQSMLRPIGERSMVFAKYITSAYELGIVCFVFGMHQINWDDKTVEGWFFSHIGWEKATLPLPNVIYDRLPNRKLEKHGPILQVKERLINEFNTPWFNNAFFNKWEIHEILKQENETAIFLPETYLQPTFELIDQLVKQYSIVYIKPINGSLGLSVYQLMYSEQEQAYYCRFRDHHKQNRLIKSEKLSKIQHSLFKNKDMDQFLVQQGIKLIRINQRTVDFRVHTNRNEDGVWEVTAIAAKVSGKGSVTTHINNGGEIYTLEEIFPSNSKQIRYLLNEAALQISQGIEHSFEGTVGEIGFDFGIDQLGKIWLFEANSRPGRSIFTHPSLKHEEKQTRYGFAKFSIYLLKKSFTPSKDGLYEVNR
ncbi:YheC/YheD family protein [Bacillus carboniphilus]|uniref:YheC/YheD family protein n=1 Tax=Bacillus carboniphilus TaxID=86663 RepID=A0ABY9JVN2_9BACI|nr:YheC/YheD family protein [Bacillus carboniphilus]WLR42803.1 YheC/YheD family protein [Bacillus carboniphilus]